MGYLNSEKPPSKWKASYFKMFVERMRTAVNFLNEDNFPNGLSGEKLKDNSVTLAKMYGFVFHQTILALAEAYSVASTTLFNVGGLLSYDTIWGDKVRMKLEVTGGSSDPSATATFELHGADGMLASITTTEALQLLESAYFDLPEENQTLILKVKTSNASYPALIVNARIVIVLN